MSNVRVWKRAKDPDEVLDYKADWTTALGTDIISTSQWIAPSGITVNSNSHDNTTTTIWLAGGTAGQIYDFVNRVVTAANRTMDQTARLKCKNR